MLRTGRPRNCGSIVAMTFSGIPIVQTGSETIWLTIQCVLGHFFGVEAGQSLEMISQSV